MNKFLKKFHPGYSLRAQISLASATMVLLLSAAIGFYAADVSKKQIEESEGNAFELRAKNALDVLDRGMFERAAKFRMRRFSMKFATPRRRLNTNGKF